MSRYLSLALLTVSLLACASSPPLQQDVLKSAREAVEAAIAAGADQHAPLELRFAREKLAAAQQANDDGDPAQARRLVREVEVEAELCLAKINAARAREATRNQREANEALLIDLSGSNQ